MTDETLTNPRAERVKAVRALPGGRSAAGRAVRRRGAAGGARGGAGGADVRDVYVTPSRRSGTRDRRRARATGHPGARRHRRGARRDEPGRAAASSRSRRSRSHALRTCAGPAAGRGAGERARPRERRARSSGPPTRPGPTPRCSTGESVDVHNPKVVRSTAGSLFHLPVVTGRRPGGRGRRAAVRRAARSSRPTAPASTTSTTCSTSPGRRAGRRPGPRAPDRLAVRQRGVGAARRGPRAGRRRRAGADPRPGRVAQPGDGGDGLPLRQRAGAAVRLFAAVWPPERRPRPPRPGARARCGVPRRGSRRPCAGPRGRRGT